jgi:hypothetical protein
MNCSAPLRRPARRRGSLDSRDSRAGAALAWRAAAVAVAWVALGAGCVDERAGVTGSQSLRVALKSPTDAGSQEQRLPDTLRQVQIDVTAVGADGEDDLTLTTDLNIHVQFLGSMTPELDAPVPLAKTRMTNGRAVATVSLPPVFGPTVIWVEDSEGPAPTFATGTSPRLWFRDPTIADISTPRDESSLAALATSPLELKQVRVDSSRYGAAGRLVVTSTYSQGYTVSDVRCADGTGAPPCVTGDYDHVTIFTFSSPRDERGREIRVGQVIAGFTGGVTEFNGLTELGFPQTFAPAGEPDVDLARLPAPRSLQSTWFGARIEFERVESSPIAVLGGTVCPVDGDYSRFKQWKLDVGNGCSGDVINVVTAGVVDFDPAANAGVVLSRVVGVLRPINIGSFNVWIIYPRSAADITR